MQNEIPNNLNAGALLCCSFISVGSSFNDLHTRFISIVPTETLSDLPDGASACPGNVCKPISSPIIDYSFLDLFLYLREVASAPADLVQKGKDVDAKTASGGSP